jgi:DNA-binding transcriptional LysR family regulator
MEGQIQKYQACLKVYELGSFSAAAVALNYSQSGISRMVQDVEHSLQFRLFERHQKQLRLTAAAEKIWPQLTQLVIAFHQLTQTAQQLNEFETGTLRIGVFSSIATHWLPPLIQQFKQRYPKVEFELLLGDYVEIEAWLHAGRIDCGFLKAPVTKGLQFEPLFKDELLAVLPVTSDWQDQVTIDLHQFDQMPFLLLQRKGASEISELLTRFKLQPQIRLTTWDDYAIMAMVESGLGISILPSLILQRVPYQICLRPLTQPQYRQIGIATRPKQALTPLTSTFLQLIRQQAAQQPPILTARTSQ